MKVAACLLFALLTLLPGNAVAAGESKVINFLIKHSVFGEIGRTSISIKESGTAVEVETHRQIKVSLLSITLFEQEARSSESWQGKHLVAYKNWTRANGETSTLLLETADDALYRVLPDGERSRLPADIWPASPWSQRFLEAQHLISPESGRLFAADFEPRASLDALHGGHPVSLVCAQMEEDFLYTFCFGPDHLLAVATIAHSSGRIFIVGTGYRLVDSSEDSARKTSSQRQAASLAPPTKSTVNGNRASGGAEHCAAAGVDQC